MLITYTCALHTIVFLISFLFLTLSIAQHEFNAVVDGRMLCAIALK